MNSKIWKVMLLVAAVTGFATAATYTVSKPGGFGAYNTISDAIAAAKDNDEVVIVDYETYEEQVTIRNLKNFTLRSENPSATRKPKIVYKDTKNILPQVKADAKDSARINFDQNGALRVMQSFNVLIDGIAVDGGGNFPFASKEDVWENIKENKWYPMQHGNAAIVLWIAGKVTVRNCDLSNAFFGISFKDRNEGGIFANSNPADIQTWKVVPLSGFGKTGDHIIEYNRIHDNSLGVFFESTWDLGTVIRYNLFYENHHPEGKSAAIKTLTTQGEHLIGGAMMFKDHILSPLTIHNNTLWHNTYAFVGNWRSGGHYLIFNNIVAEPYSDPAFENPWQILDPYFTNRMFNSVYACHIRPIDKQNQNVQATDPETNQQVVVKVTVYQPRIMNQFGEVEATDITVPIELSTSTTTQVLRNVKVQGNRVISASTKTGGYTADNNIRWLETKFKSEDPEDADFLVPDWDDSLVNRYIVDQGYAAVGISDPDGSPADLGAIPKEGGSVPNSFRIVPTSPVSIKNNSAMVSFMLEGNVTDPKIKYIKWIHKLPVAAVFGKEDVLIPKSDIISFTDFPDVKIGNNILSFTVPARTDSNLYAFFELVIEGIDPETKLPVQSVVGSLPYRKIDYLFDVEIFDLDGTTKMDTVQAGQPVILRITPKRLDKTPWDENSPIEKTDVSLFSSFDLLDSNNVKLQVPKFTKMYETKVKFTRVPTGGLEIVAVGGLFKASNNDTLAIRGSSDPITVKAGLPDSLEFQDPPSKGFAKIDPGRPFDVTVQVYDKYGNKIDQQTDVSLSSTRVDKADVVGGGPKTVKTDSSGLATFKVEVTGGTKNDTIPLSSKLVLNNKTDNAFLIVGEARDRLFIFYEGDSSLNVPNDTLAINGCSDIKVPIVVKRIGVVNDTKELMSADSDTVSFDIQRSSGIGIYATSDPGDNTIVKTATTVGGKVTLWIKATGYRVSNGSINVYPIDNPAVLPGERGNINFDACTPAIAQAAYFSDSGDGKVNRLEIYYEDTLAVTEIPDSFQLYWPYNQGTPKIIKGSDLSSVTLDSNNKKHLSIKFNDPFNPDPMVTKNYSLALGTSMWKNPLLEEATTITSRFNIQDSVGPLLMSAVMVENLSKTDDTLFINFSEDIDLNLIVGQTLRVAKQNTVNKVDLDIKSASKVAGDTIKIIVTHKDDVSISEGDSLSIISTGKITDINTNHANANNRPVIIRMRSICPSVIHSYYKDVDGNGIVDQITVTFNKKVKSDSLSAAFKWADGGDCVVKESQRMTYGTDSTRIIMNVTGMFDSKGISTTGAMSIDVTYKDYNNAVSSWTVTDSAAPVIAEAILYPGSVSEDETVNKDTLKIKFSEGIESAQLAATKQLFRFYHYDSNTKAVVDTYSIELTKLRDEDGNTTSFLVDNIVVLSNVLKGIGFNFPKNGDLVRMLVGDNGIFADDNGNFQRVTENRLASLKVMSIPTTAIVKAGPIPFIPENGKSVKITIKPRAKMVENVETKARVIIYDRMGNKLFYKEQSNNPNGVVEIEWNGYNENGRLVGVGTYLAVVKYRMNSDSEQSKSIKIARKKP